MTQYCQERALALKLLSGRTTGSQTAVRKDHCPVREPMARYGHWRTFLQQYAVSTTVIETVSSVALVRKHTPCPEPVRKDHWLSNCYQEGPLAHLILSGRTTASVRKEHCSYSTRSVHVQHDLFHHILWSSGLRCISSTIRLRV